MRLNSQHVNTQDGPENDLTYMTLGRIIDMRVDPALEDVLSFLSDWIRDKATYLTLKYSGSVWGSFSNLDR